MTAGQSTPRLSKVSLAPAPLAALLAATLLGGATIGAALTRQFPSTDSGAAGLGAAGQPGATFDAVRFRAEEHATLFAKPASGTVSPEQRDRLGGK